MAQQFNGDGTPVGGYPVEYQPPAHRPTNPAGSGTPVRHVSNPAYPKVPVAPPQVVPGTAGRRGK